MAELKQLKKNTAVTFTRRNGAAATGTVVTVEETGRGHWVHVNTGDKKNPAITKIRLSEANLT